jgi:hypothetical protein
MLGTPTPPILGSRAERRARYRQRVDESTTIGGNGYIEMD